MKAQVGMFMLVLVGVGPAAAEEITYTKHVAPILWKNCAGCHRPGEVGPFPLLTYKDAAKRANHLKELTAQRRMPPWKAEPGFGEFQDVRRLSDHDLDILAKWADGGAKEGDPRDLPAPPTFPQGWQLGTPDLVLKMQEPLAVPASGPDVYRCFVIPIDLSENKTVAAVEFRPGNRKIVHHALFFLDNTGQARKLDEADPGPGYRSFGGIGFTPTGSLGGWAPGMMPHKLPDGLGRLLRKGSDLVLQIHYHLSGKPETDQSTLGIYFTKEPGVRVVLGVPLINRNLDIPAGDKRYRVTADFTLPVDGHAVGITPHMHYLGREMKVTAVLPDGKKTPMIWVKDWDFNWQNQYLYADLVALPKGTRLEVEAFYDNSADNPKNPNNPPKAVYWGEQTTDEMCLCAVQLVPDQHSGYVPLLLELAKMRKARTGKADAEPAGSNPGKD